MGSLPVLKASGLATTNNQLSGVPEGGMVRATNTVLRNKFIVESRRGQARLTYTLADAADRALTGAHYQDALLVHHGVDGDELSRDTGVAFSGYTGSFFPPTPGRRVRFAEAAKNLYFATADGVYGLDNILSTPALAGVPRALNILVTSGLAAGSGWMPVNTRVGYRTVLGIKDANDNVKLGSPSGIFCILNPADITQAIGVMTIDASGWVAVNQAGHNYLAGDTFTVAPGEANIPAGSYTVDTDGGTRLVTSSQFWFDTGAPRPAGTNTAIQSIKSFAKETTLFAPIPQGTTTSHFLRVYRSELAEAASGDASKIVPEFFLVKELPITVGDIASGYVTFADVTPESFLGPPLYTNPNTGEGDINGNERPPHGNDLCFWDDRLWCVSTFDKARFFLTMLGIGSPDGIQDGDTITFAGQTYTAKDVPALSTHFQIYSDGSPGQNLENTARDFVDKVNFNGSNSQVTAYYISGEDDAPGQMLLEGRALTDFFSVYGSRPASWNPVFGTTSGTAQAAVDDARPNGLAYSKPGQPEAFPLTNWLVGGPANAQALRAIPFRDKLYVFSSAGKIFTVSGQAPYVVNELDGSAKLIAPESVVVHANQVFALTDQGVGILTDAGFRIVSRGIEDELLDVLALDPDVVTAYAFGVSYESDRQYLLFVPTSNDDTCATRAYVFNSLDETWTRWDMSRTFGLVSPVDGKLWMGDGEAATLREERKSYDRTDFADEELAAELLVVGEDGVTLTLDSVADIKAGDMLAQDGLEAQALVLEVDLDANTVEVLGSQLWESGAVRIFKAIDVEGKFCPVIPGDPADIRQFRDAVLHFREFACHDFTATYDTETMLAEQSATLAPADGFGLDAFGQGAFGAPLGLRNRRVEVARNAQQSSYIRVGFRIRQAWGVWALNGFTLHVEGAGTASKP